MKTKLIFTFLFMSLSLASMSSFADEDEAQPDLEHKVSKDEIVKSLDAMVAQGLVSAADAKEAKKKLIQMDAKEMDRLTKQGADMARKPGAEKMPLMPKLDTTDLSEED